MYSKTRDKKNVVVYVQGSKTTVWTFRHTLDCSSNATFGLAALFTNFDRHGDIEIRLSLHPSSAPSISRGVRGVGKRKSGGVGTAALGA